MIPSTTMGRRGRADARPAPPWPTWDRAPDQPGGTKGAREKAVDCANDHLGLVWGGRASGQGEGAVAGLGWGAGMGGLGGLGLWGSKN